MTDEAYRTEHFGLDERTAQSARDVMDILVGNALAISALDLDTGELRLIKRGIELPQIEADKPMLFSTFNNLLITQRLIHPEDGDGYLRGTALSVDIQLIRFEDRFACEIEVDDALMSCMVPKLVLQPIVENAVIHGVRDMDDGYIKIWAEADAGDLRLFVQDNGRGMEKPQDGPLGFRSCRVEVREMIYFLQRIMNALQRFRIIFTHREKRWHYMPQHTVMISVQMHIVWILRECGRILKKDLVGNG